MKVIVGGRRAGKTTTLLQECGEGDAIIVATIKEKERVMQLAKELGRPDVRVFSADQARIGIIGQPFSRIFVDNAEWVLAAYLNAPLTGITVTGDLWGIPKVKEQ